MTTTTKAKKEVKETTLSKAKQKALVEEAATLKKAIDNFKPTQDRFKKVQDSLKGTIPNDYDPDEVYSIQGITHVVEFSKAAKENEIKEKVGKLSGMEYLHNLMGSELFYKVAKITITDLKKYLTEEELDKVLNINQGTKRNFKIREK